MSRPGNPEARFAAAMGARSFGVPKPVAATPVRTLPTVGPGQVLLGELDAGGELGVALQKLTDGRLLVQGVSGAGKSYTLRRLIEQCHGRIQQILIDPEGEFGSVAELLGLLKLEGHRLDTGALAIAAGRAREHQISLVLDLSELDREGQMKAIAAFLHALIDSPREHWHPVIVAIDEAHLFAPFGGDAVAATSVRKAAIGAVTDLMSRGRKRGLVGVLATQRIARLAKSVVSEVHNFLIGMNTLDLDIRRAAETIGWDARRGFDRLPLLEPGQFVAVGPAFSLQPAQVKVGACRSRHIGAAPALKAPAAIDAANARAVLDIDQLIEASDEAAELIEAPVWSRLRAVRTFIREPGFPLAGRVYQALLPLAPDGARLEDLAKHLAVAPETLAAAVALLHHYGAIDLDGEGDARAARIARVMTQARGGA